MPSLLVTGGAGFIGANFVRYWMQHHPDDAVIVLDALTYAGNRANLAGLDGLHFIEGDIRETEAVERLLSEQAIDTIVHFAAESHVDRSIDGPDAFIDTNVIGTHSLLKAARSIWLEGAGRPHRFHHVSTDEVYGSLGPEDHPFLETTPYAPNSPYSASKAGSDHLVRAYHHTFGLETSITNCSNNYGPYQFPEKLIPLFLVNCLLGKNLPIYGDGMNVRDWLHVEDHCRGIELVLQGGIPGQTYNIGGGEELANSEVVNLLCAGVDEAFSRDAGLAERFPDAPAATGQTSASLKTYVSDRLGHDRRYAIDCQKITKTLGYEPQRTFEHGLNETISWYLENDVWWQSIMNGSYRDLKETNA